MKPCKTLLLPINRGVDTYSGHLGYNIMGGGPIEAVL